jgi:hypothetical protein
MKKMAETREIAERRQAFYAQGSIGDRERKATRHIIMHKQI